MPRDNSFIRAIAFAIERLCNLNERNFVTAKPFPDCRPLIRHLRIPDEFCFSDRSAKMPVHECRKSSAERLGFACRGLFRSSRVPDLVRARFQGVGVAGLRPRSWLHALLTA